MASTSKQFSGIMLSSTFSDLKEHRKAAIEAIHQLGFHANAMEYSGASIGPDVLGKSLEMVSHSVAYVLVIGHRYGQMPVDPKRNPDKRSITELEFNEAIARGLPIVLFVMADTHPVTKATGGWDTDQDRVEKLDAFITRAKLNDPRDPDCEVDRVWETFQSENDFAFRVALAIGNLARKLEPRGSSGSAPDAPQPSTQSVVAPEELETLPKTIRQIVSEVLDRSRPQGVQDDAVIALARRIAADVQSTDEAVAQLSEAIDAFIRLRDAAARGSNFGYLIDAALKEIAERNATEQFEAGLHIGERAFAALAEQEEALKAAKVAMALANVDQARVIGDAYAMARWISEGAAIEPEQYQAIATKIQEYGDRGWVRGVRFDLEVAVALAQRLVELALTDAERGDAASWLGVAMSRHGTRADGETGMALLDKGIAAFRDALVIYAKLDMSDWAATQHNLGIALKVQGERIGGERGLALISLAVTAYREALTVHTLEAMPTAWARTQSSLGNALDRQGELTEGSAGLAILAEAVETYRAALVVWKKDTMSIDWAGTQNDLGTALSAQGERVGGKAGIKLIDVAIEAYRAALTVRTEGDFPVDWAMTMENLALAYEALADAGSHAASNLSAAEAALLSALRVYTPEHMPYDYGTATNSLARVRAKIAALPTNPIPNC